MYQHILVPLDGSPMAESALPVAAYLSEKFQARVTLVHVIEKDAPHEVHGQPHLRDAEQVTAYLQGVSQRVFREDIQVDYHVHTAEVKNVAESIVAHASELGHDLIVMCTHGRGRALHLLLGSIAQNVISMGSVPVLITHPEENGDIPAFSCGAILVPLDGNADHAQALPVAKELAMACGASLHLVMVIPSFGALSGQMTVTSRLLPGTTSKMLEMSAQSAEESLQSQLEELQRQGFAASAHVLRGNPADLIVDSARQSEIDLIVLATHGRSGMEALWAGSVTHKVCSRCKIPLLLIPVA